MLFLVVGCILALFLLIVLVMVFKLNLLNRFFYKVKTKTINKTLYV